MSDQGAVPDGGVSGFGLIETLLWTPSDGFFLLDLHLGRLGDSARRLGFSFDRAAALAALIAAVEGFSQGAATPPQALRVRLVLQQGGALEVGAVAIEPVPPQTVWRVAVARARFDSGQPLLGHKTTRRELYESELAASGADEVLFLNERDEVCEGARANVFLERGGKLLTPPLSCGLLPGTLRANLLREGRAKEAVLRLSDFEGADFFMGNSVRGLVRARLY
ncbi:aminotransferase class IV family protein [Methylocystis heyeri]|uniref:Probable branched-chain-amino-acid aminotransferase n=1 Tax=Methylocystis heyeri TaxID=391905 RepID=A0A6B8KFY6_9HYPH|nr:aminotransferase class IV family protein [Methylocystis heyeri]QGM45350.1 aminotransferase class IV [Methylocystis heyeri]